MTTLLTDQLAVPALIVLTEPDLGTVVASGYAMTATIPPASDWSGDTYAQTTMPQFAAALAKRGSAFGITPRHEGGSRADLGRSTVTNSFPIRTGLASCSPPV